MEKRIGLIILVAVLLVLPALAYATGTGGEAPAPTEGGEKTLWDMLKAGGTVGWLIMILSVVGLGLAIEHTVNIRNVKLCPPELVAELEGMVEEGQYEEALSLCQANPTLFSNIIGAALSKVSGGYDEMVKAMEEAGEEEAIKLNQKISYMNLIGLMAPMLGLLGTVTGMIRAFTVIEQLKSPSPALLAKGVYEALVTTCMGLVVAIPALGAYFFFKNKVTKMIVEVGILCGEFIDKFKPQQQSE